MPSSIFFPDPSSLPKIQESIEIDSSRDVLWDVVSDLNSEPEFWHGTKSVKEISRQGNVTDREIVQNFGNHTISQKVILKPKDEIEVRYLKGVTEGVKILKLESTSEDKQRLTAYWDIRFPGIYSLMSPVITNHVRKGTTAALQRIKDVSESLQVKKAEQKKS